MTSSQGVTLSSAVVRCCSTSNQLCKINIKTKILHVLMCIHCRHCLNKKSPRFFLGESTGPNWTFLTIIDRLPPNYGGFRPIPVELRSS